MKTRIMMMLTAALFAGCAMNSISLSDLDQAGRRVTAKAEHFNVLGLTSMPAETAARLLEDLNGQCGNSGVTGVTTTSGTVWVVIGVIERVEATGYCKSG